MRLGSRAEIGHFLSAWSFPFAAANPPFLSTIHAAHLLILQIDQSPLLNLSRSHYFLRRSRRRCRILSERATRRGSSRMDLDLLSVTSTHRLSPTNNTLCASCYTTPHQNSNRQISSLCNFWLTRPILADTFHLHLQSPHRLLSAISQITLQRDGAQRAQSYQRTRYSPVSRYYCSIVIRRKSKH